MKKLLGILAIVAVSLSANSQDLKSKRGESFLPEKGDWSIGFSANGLFEFIGNSFNGSTENSAPSVDFPGTTAFVGKKFTSATTANRYTANLMFQSQKGGDNMFGIAAGLGKEWRKGKTRLQGFYGADALVSFGSAKTSGVSTSQMGVGVNGFLGAEYFILPKMAIGAQYNYGVGFESSKDADGTTTSSFGLGGVGINGGSLTMNLYF